MDVHSALQAGQQGIVFTIFSISGTLLFGYLIGKWFVIDKKTSFLISSGTAICGGSAIAAISPVIKAEEKQISVALGCVFILNSIALFLFPVIGHYFNLSQTQFGLWCALAIHDTSSVVGAAAKFGPRALEVATTVKLARALWIIPVAFISSFVFKNKSKKISVPYFIGLFIVAMVINTYVPSVSIISSYMVLIAKAGLTLTLFLIGAGLSRKVLTSVGFKTPAAGAAPVDHDIGNRALCGNAPCLITITHIKKPLSVMLSGFRINKRGYYFSLWFGWCSWPPACLPGLPWR